MGIVIFDTYLAYLIDNDGFVLTCPCQLFKILDNKIDVEWHFRLVNNDEDIYPFIQGIIGYPGLCSDKKAYENLIIEKEEYAERIYFRRKLELEEKYKNDCRYESK